MDGPKRIAEKRTAVCAARARSRAERNPATPCNDRGSRAHARPPVPFRRTAANQFQYGRSAVRCRCARAVLFRCSSACDGVCANPNKRFFFFFRFFFHPLPTSVAISSFQGGGPETMRTGQLAAIPKCSHENTVSVWIWFSGWKHDDDDVAVRFGYKSRQFSSSVRVIADRPIPKNRPRKCRRNCVPRFRNMHLRRARLFHYRVRCPFRRCDLLSVPI